MIHFLQLLQSKSSPKTSKPEDNGASLSNNSRDTIEPPYLDKKDNFIDKQDKKVFDIQLMFFIFLHSSTCPHSF